MKSSIKIVIAFMLISTATWSQNTISVSLLEGEWHAHEKTTVDSRYGDDAVQNEVNFTLVFLDATTVNFKEGSKDNIINYGVENDILILEYRNYIIMELTTSKLTLKEEGPVGELIYFKKVESGGY